MGRQFGWVHPRSFAVWKRSRSELLARVQTWTKPRKDRWVESLQFLVCLNSRCFVMLFHCSAAAVSFLFLFLFLLVFIVVSNESIVYTDVIAFWDHQFII